MWKFVDKICPWCATDIATVEPKYIGERGRHPYGVCPNCSRACPVIEVEPKPKARGRRAAPEPVSEPAVEEAPSEEPEPEPAPEPGVEPSEE